MNANQTAIQEESGNEELELVELLSRRFGDGQVYLPEGSSRALYLQAVENGYINDEGYLTRKGRVLVASRNS